MSHSLRYLANCSMLFTELPLLQRPRPPRSAGFGAVEFWWPFEDPVPGDAAVDAFVGAVGDAGVRLVGLNFFAGDLRRARLRACCPSPARSQQFRDNIDVTVGIGERLGVSGFNALYGDRVDGVAPQEQDELALTNIVDAARAAAGIGATVFIEPVSGPKPYPLRTRRRRGSGGGPGPGRGRRQRGDPVRHLPPRHQRRRHRPRHRGLRRPGRRTSRSRTPPAAASRARASSTSTATWPGSSRPATPAGSGWSTSRRCPPWTASPGSRGSAGPARKTAGQAAGQAADAGSSREGSAP